MIKYLLLLLIACGCSKVQQDNSQTLVSMQIIDRNGFQETVSTKDRLNAFEKIDFLTPQPYQKILRVYGRDREGKPSSKITSYHPNGQICQYLEVKEGRAQGVYKEWYSSGQLKTQASVIEGVADIHELAQSTWVFHGQAGVWDESGNLMAEFSYDKGLLTDTARYYYPSGKPWKVIPYVQNEIHGTLEVFSEEGTLLETSAYLNGLKQGLSKTCFSEEMYEKGKLMEGTYKDRAEKVTKGIGTACLFEEGRLVSLVSINEGVPEGLISQLDEQGGVQSTYHIKEGKKNGEEISFFPGTKRPKLSLTWQDDVLQGSLKTWYENGQMESQRDMRSNKRQGLAFAWYQDGAIMLMEEYDNDLLTKGSYYRPGDKLAVSTVTDGKGTATLYDAKGLFLKKIPYEKGKPLLSDER